MTQKDKLGIKRPEDQGLYRSSMEKDSCGVGFVCHMKGRPSRQILLDAQHMNCCMTHRGGVGYEENTGDGAGILTGMPDRFFRSISKELFQKDLPPQGQYAVGIFFFPQDEEIRLFCEKVASDLLNEISDLTFIGWRDLPVSPDRADIGKAARTCMPVMRQLFVETTLEDRSKFSRKLYEFRKRLSHKIRASKRDKDDLFYVVSLSEGTIIYKGMLMPEQVFPFFDDLNDERYESHLALVHSRFSTNTFPSWDRAQPIVL